MSDSVLLLTDRDLARFQSKLIERGPDECWGWAGSIFSTGYPAFWLRSNNVGGHRIACQLAHGPGRGQMALHSCDRPICCNPQHLRWGTPADNMADRTLRERAPRGEQHHGTFLTESEVRDIRERVALGDQLSAVGRDYGTSCAAIHNIVSRKTWRHVA